MRHPNYREIGKRFRRTSFWRDEEPLSFPAEGFDLYNLSYHSAHAHYLLGQEAYTCPEHGLRFEGEGTTQWPTDAVIENNNHFRYPLVCIRRPSAHGYRQERVLILLHGLNERSFTKYIPWAYQIGMQTGSAVLLFPMTFHINRVLPDWGRTQQESYLRRKGIEGNENAHRFNAVISERLGDHPERFFWGALQSYWDIVDLLRAIRAGRHPLVAPEAHVDLFGYSAGGYVALALLLADSEGVFRDGRGILFASCASVRDTNLSSHLIMDHMAEVSLMKLFVKYRDRLSNGRLKHWLDYHAEGRWLNCFCGLSPKRPDLDLRLRQLAPRLLGITNLNDQVMPPGAMLNALQGIRRDTGVRVEEFELGIHENPFACHEYTMRDRTLITEFFDEERYGTLFERFIGKIVDHLSGTG